MTLANTPASASSRLDLFECDDSPWHVLHTKSRQEKALSDGLTSMGLANFLPLFRQVRFYGKHKVVVNQPLFASYVFMRGTLDDVYRADRTKRVAHIIPVPDQRQLNDELRQIHLALQQDAQLDVFPYLTRGTRVEVRSGPLRGLQGVVEERGKQNRLILQIEMLGRAVSVELDAALLDRID
jgi:transcription antitermination factor NusG